MSCRLQFLLRAKKNANVMAQLSSGSPYIRTMTFSDANITSSSLPTKVSARFISLLSRNRAYKGAGRLYLAIRHNIGSRYDPSDVSQKAFLLQYFKVNQIQRLSKILVQHKLARRNAAGILFLTSVSTIVAPMYGKSGRRVKERHVDVPLSVLQDNEKWSEFVNGVDWSDLAMSMKTSSKTKKRSKFYSVDKNNWGTVVMNGRSFPARDLSADSRVVQGLSNSVYAQSAGCHKSTASRRRRKGMKSGIYDLARWFHDLPENVTAWDRQHAELAGIENWDPNRLVFVDGVMKYEAPSQLLIRDIFTVR